MSSKSIHLALIGLVLFQLAAAASVTVPVEPLRPLLEGVREWVLSTGTSTVIRRNVVEALGLGAADLPVKQRAIRALGARFTEVVSIPTQGGAVSSNIILFGRVDESDGTCIVWRSGLDGQLVTTVTLRPDDASSEDFNNSDFTEVKLFFLYQSQKETNGAGQSSNHASPRPVGNSFSTIPAVALPSIAARSTPLPKMLFGSETTALCAGPWGWCMLITAFIWTLLVIDRR
jgi:hypothetical protein